MDETSGANRQADEPRESYASNWEHLTDELRRLDLLIRLCLLRESPKKAGNPLEQFRGLALSDEEIAGLLAGPERRHADDAPATPEHQARDALVTALNQLEGRIQQRLAASSKDAVYVSLPILAQLFHLSRFEEHCLIIALAPELDRKYEKLYAYLQDEVTRKKPSADLVLNLLCQTMPEKLAARAVFDPRAPLLKYRLVQMTDNSPDSLTTLLQRFITLDARSANFLLGYRQMDARLEYMADVIEPQTTAPLTPAIEGLREQVRDFVQTHLSPQSRARNVFFYLHGPYGSGKHALAKAVSHDLGFPLLIGDVERMLSGPLAFEEAIWLLCREAVLQPAVLCLEQLDGLLSEADKHRVHVKSLMEAMRMGVITMCSSGPPLHQKGKPCQHTYHRASTSRKCPRPSRRLPGSAPAQPVLSASFPTYWSSRSRLWRIERLARETGPILPSTSRTTPCSPRPARFR